jgi:transposase-like protein
MKATSDHEGFVAVAVASLFIRGGRVIFSPLPNCSKAGFLKIIKGHVSPINESIIFTNRWRKYDGAALEACKIYRFHDIANELDRVHRHINGNEYFWSYVKTRLTRIGGIRSDALFYNLDETAWRFNHWHHNFYQNLLKNSPAHL